MFIFKGYNTPESCILSFPMAYRCESIDGSTVSIFTNGVKQGGVL